MTEASCLHLVELDADDTEIGAPPDADGCTDCLAIGGSWVHLRRCLDCGHVGCCDSSPNRHATAHFQASGHPLIQSYEPGEEWIWCYIDQMAVELDGLPPSPSHP
ncbi:MAG: hypothetical protein JWM89_2438 [Acidimicrobiales bacterium]|nr:hypothetical protein [Acidimicrobiales bacterium]